MHRKSLWHEKPLPTPLLNIDTVCRPERAWHRQVRDSCAIRREACRVHVTTRCGVHSCCDTSRRLTHECPVSYRRKGHLHVLTDRQARHRVRTTTDARLDSTSRFAQVGAITLLQADGDRSFIFEIDLSSRRWRKKFHMCARRGSRGHQPIVLLTAIKAVHMDLTRCTA